MTFKVLSAITTTESMNKGTIEIYLLIINFNQVICPTCKKWHHRCMYLFVSNVNLHFSRGSFNKGYNIASLFASQGSIIKVLSGRHMMC